MSSKLRVASWVLLTLMCCLLLWGSLVSANLTYSKGTDQLVPGETSVADVESWNAAAATAIRGRRGTAAAFATAYAVLLLVVVLVPYRRGEVWSWWAILAAALVLAAVTALRIPALEYRLGVGTALAHLTVVVVALLLDVGRLRGKS
jgi:hypothetical protein